MTLALSTVSQAIAWFTLHTHLAYAIFFLGAYSETLIGPSFFVPGEVIFISAGILTSTHVLSFWFSALLLYSGAILGDHSSYWLGRRYGKHIFKKDRFIFSTENYEKGDAFFKKYGAKSAFFARLLGPLSWITPFLAGIYRVPYGEFALYNALGVLVGVSEFFIGGYLFGTTLVDALSSTGRFLFLLPLGVVAVFVGGYYITKQVTDTD